MFIKIGQRSDHGFDEPLGLLSDCHRRIEHFLHVLSAIADRCDGGTLSPTEAKQLEGAVTYFAVAAPKHTADEEKSLFPRLQASVDPRAAAALDIVARLEHDHEAAEDHHRTIDRLARRWLAGGSLSRDDAGHLSERLRRLRVLYADHIRVEDGELFPAAARILGATDIREIGREMAERRHVDPGARP